MVLMIVSGAASQPIKKAPVDFVPTIRGSLIERESGPGAWISAIDSLFSDHPKSLDLISIYLSGLMISFGNLRLLKHASIADNSVK